MVNPRGSGVNNPGPEAFKPHKMDLSLGVRTLPMPPRLDAQAERDLVELARRRNLDAFGRIVDAYQARVLGFVRRMVKGQEDALDITQEVFIRAFQAMDRFDGRCGLKTWLFRIAYNLCVDRSRRTDRSATEVSLEFSDPECEPREFADDRWNPETVILGDELHGIVEAALANMSPKLKTVLLMHDGEEMAYEEIAETVGIPVGTVKSRLFLARNHLKTAIENYRQGETHR